MGCGSSSEAKQPTVAAVAVPPHVALPDTTAAQVAPPAGQTGKGQGKGRGKGKGKGKGKGRGKGMKGRFQVLLGGNFKDYEPQEDTILKRAYLVGQPNARFHFRGQDYEYNFASMKQRNLGSSKERDIRPPLGMTAPPSPILPMGNMTVIRVPAGAGKSIELQDPNDPGKKITVALPPGAKPGMQMAVPLPGKGESVQDVMEKQKKGWPTAAKVAAGAVGVGGLAVGGVILGEHLTDGAISEATGISEIATAAEWTEGAVADAAEWTEGAVADAGEWVAGAAGDAHEWLEGAGEDVGRAVMGTAEDVGEWTADAFDDVTDWIGDAGEDIGSFVMELF